MGRLYRISYKYFKQLTGIGQNRRLIAAQLADRLCDQRDAGRIGDCKNLAADRTVLLVTHAWWRPTGRPVLQRPRYGDLTGWSCELFVHRAGFAPHYFNIN